MRKSIPQMKDGHSNDPGYLKSCYVCGFMVFYHLMLHSMAHIMFEPQ